VTAQYLHQKMTDDGLPISGIGWNTDGSPRVDWEQQPTQQQLDRAAQILAEYDPVSAKAEQEALERELILAQLHASLSAARAEGLTRAELYLTKTINALSA
jgi:hypothetical protein